MIIQQRNKTTQQVRSTETSRNKKKNCTKLKKQTIWKQSKMKVSYFNIEYENENLS